jgi:transcription elongation factor GreA
MMITLYTRHKFIDDIHMLNNQLSEISTRIAAARGQGGFEDNEELHVQLEELRRKQTEIDMLQTAINYPIIPIRPIGKCDYVTIGSTLLLRDIDTEKETTYTILGKYESDPNKGIISNESPFANCFMDCAVGEIVDFTHGSIYRSYEIIDIYFDDIEKILEK